MAAKQTWPQPAFPRATPAPRSPRPASVLAAPLSVLHLSCCARLHHPCCSCIRSSLVFLCSEPRNKQHEAAMEIKAREQQPLARQWQHAMMGQRWSLGSKSRRGSSRQATFFFLEAAGERRTPRDSAGAPKVGAHFGIFRRPLAFGGWTQMLGARLESGPQSEPRWRAFLLANLLKTEIGA
jgi:hypothetical protein